MLVEATRPRITMPTFPFLFGFLATYTLIGIGGLYAAWRMTSRFDNTSRRLALWSFVFAVLFCPIRIGATYILAPRIVVLVLDFVDAQRGWIRHATFESLLTICFIPFAITWLVVFIIARYSMRAWMKRNDQPTSLVQK